MSGGSAAAGQAAAFRFVALGDSLTAGIGDPAPGGGWRGWAALLADALVVVDARAEPRGRGAVAGHTARGEGAASGPVTAVEAPAVWGSLDVPGGPADSEWRRADRGVAGVEFVNLARSGALATEMAEAQLATARRSRPRLASVVVGGNDTLRAAFDIRRVAEALDLTMRGLSEDGALLLTACLPDPGRMLGLPRPLAAPLTRRMRALNTVVHVLARRYGAVHVHLAEHAWAADPAARTVDRLHPSELGHRLLAREFHTELGRRGVPLGPAPSITLDGPRPTLAASTWWLATRGSRWVADRCRDLLPDLVRQAALESGHHLRGTAHLLDTRTRVATRGALTLTQSTPTPALDAGDTR
ncbi:SGNH/GDSL hydrolase family protein [Streptomyces sp. NPDC057702]|uniref:SGNH/GDSL hydrolase family protein n=1 Tax=unclassified Streptomyces TaxID=2593676 RepID=UPI0036B6165B